MKKITRILVVLSLITTGILFSPKKSTAQDVVDVQVFYDQLSPYGSWVSDPNYGYVWVPDAGADFTPYGTDGYWEWSDDGWLWVSDYPWGWAPFHYGRWNFDNNYGWMWVPGRTWGPAWVSWRSCPGYYGWCALGPGIGVNGYASFNPPASRWVFVQDKYINSPHVTQYYERRENNANIYGRTKIIDNRHVDNARHTTYFAGPRREDVQKVTGTEIKPVVIRDNAKPGQAVGNGEVSIYRPSVQKTAANAARKPAPQKVAAVRDLKPIPGGHAQESLSHQPVKTTALNKTSSHSVAPKASTSQQPKKQQQHNKTQVNNAQTHKQPQQPASTPNVNKTQPHKQVQHAAPRSNNTQPQKQVQHKAAPRQQTKQAPKPQPAQQAPRQQPAPHQNNATKPAQQPRVQPRPQAQPRPQPTPQARPAEQPHPQQEQPQQEESRPR